MRFLIRFFVFLVVLAAIAYTVIWFYASSTVQNRLQSEIQKRLGSDTVLQMESVAVSGFPLSFNVDVNELSVEAPTKGLFWQAPAQVGASYSIFSPLTINANVSGEHLISGIGSQADLPPMTLNLDAKTIFASVGLDQKLKAINIDIPSAVFNIDGLGDAVLDDLDFELMPAGENAAFKGTLASFKPSEPISELVSLKGAAFNGTIIAGLPKSPRQRHISAWQRAGGIINLDSFKAEVAPVVLDGKGTIGLSDRLQPNVKLTTYAQNFDEMLTKLVSYGLIPEDKLPLVQLGSVMFKRPARSGQGNEMVLPLTINDGNVSFGPLKLLQLPEINWR